MDVGDLAPDFCLQSTSGEVCLADLHAEGPAVLIFYTSDFTPLCTDSLNILTQEFAVLVQLNTTVITACASVITCRQKIVQTSSKNHFIEV